jgi:heme O synthase-like polyprenyltransferase
MTIAASIFLIAVGAILRFALNVHVQGVSLDTVGLILMLAGLAGLVLGFVQYSMWTRRSNRVDPRLDERRDPPPPAAY